ncbi:MAG: DUF1513 domain-containing protein [Hyphomicrobium sp.]
MLDRRALLLGTVAAIGAHPLAAAATQRGSPAYASAARLDDGTHALVLLSRDGAVLRNIPLSARGHDVAMHRVSGRAVAFARRPGTFAVAFDVRRPGAPIVFDAIENRHFFGHGAFSLDGRLLFASENDIAGARGVIGIYDAESDYRRIGEHPSHGLGPHEIVLLGDGRTLAVANGGLDTAPEAGRENLNLDAMEPSLAFLDSRTGALKARHALTGDLRRLSLRHIAADAFGRVWFGGQWEGDLSNAPALIGSAGIDRDLELIADGEAPARSLKGYIGSVAIDARGSIFAASAPKAGRVVYIDCATGRNVSQSMLRDACGVAGEEDGSFCVSSGFGALRRETPAGSIISEAELATLAFDNHLRRIA